MRTSLMVLIGALLTVLGGCDNSQEFREVREGQRELRAKLVDLEKKIDQIASRPAAAPARQQADPNKVVKIDIGNSPVKGPKDAKVVMAEFADFQCPFCSKNQPLVQQVLDAYPKDVKFVYKEFPLTNIHKNAMGASKAAIAAQKQGKYWEMHDKLFENYRALDAASVKKYAAEVGLDVDQWEKDWNSTEVDKRVQDDMRLARSIGVRGTPTMFVNGKRVTNRSFEGIKEMIDAALK